ncbi:MAG: hypothetical protein WC673_03065 [Candidatus Paceibacterota bacterium]|jgi:hypothetical protein
MKTERTDYDYLIDMLIVLGYVTRERVANFRRKTPKGTSVVLHMLTKKVITPTALTFTRATHFNCEMVCLRKTMGQEIPDRVIATIPAAVARKYRVIPLEKNEMGIKVAISDPSDLATIDSLGHLLGTEITLVVATENDIAWALNRFYPENPKRQDWWRRGRK